MMKRSVDKKSSINWSKMVVLIIDDNRVSSTLLKSELNRVGFGAVSIASTLNDAVRFCRGQHFDFLLIDFHLDSGMKGSVVVAELRSKRLIDSTSGVVLMSTDSSSDIAVNALSSHFDAFVTKPVNIRGLVVKMTEIRQAIAALSPIRVHEEIGDIRAAVVELTQLCLRYPSNYRYECELLDMLERHQLWSQLSDWFMMHESHHLHQRRELSKARYYWHIKEPDVAIRILVNLISCKPRYIFAYDTLVSFYEQQQNLTQAMLYSEKAIALFPASCDRLVKLSQLASDAHDIERVLCSGKALAKHLPTTSSDWYPIYCSYMDALMALFVTLPAKVSRRHVLNHLRIIEDRACFLLSKSDGVLLKSTNLISIAHGVLPYQQYHEAHVRLMIGLSPYFSRMHVLDDRLLRKALAVSIATGERWLVCNIRQILDARDSGAAIAIDKTQDLNSEDYHLGCRQLHRAHQLFESQPIAALALCRQYLLRYPESVEAKLLVNSLELRQASIGSALATDVIDKLPLPNALKQWNREMASDRSSHARHIYLQELCRQCHASCQLNR